MIGAFLMSHVYDLSGRRFVFVEDSDPMLLTVQDVLDLIAVGIAEDAPMIVVPVEKLDPSFFQLRTGLAGDMLQKLATYRFTLAVLGDVTKHCRESAAFRDFVTESNRGDAVTFLADLAALTERLSKIGSVAGR
jgi:hypothetical protein